MMAGYPHDRRITRRVEFERVLQTGKRVRAPDLDARYLASPSSMVRVGLIVPLHGRTAVERNRLKRRLRELARAELLPLGMGADVVIRCRTSAYACTFDGLRTQVQGVSVKLRELERKGPQA